MDRAIWVWGKLASATINLETHYLHRVVFGNGLLATKPEISIVSIEDSVLASDTNEAIRSKLTSKYCFIGKTID